MTICSSLQLIMHVKKSFMIVLHLIVSSRCSSLQLIITVKKCVIAVLHLSFLQKTMTMFVFTTNYACNKCVMIVLHFIVSCRKL